MQLIGISKAYCSYGASGLTNVADFVGRFLTAVAPHDLNVEIVSWHRDPGPPRRSLESLFEQFEADYLTLPWLRYRRRANVLDVRYASRFSADKVLSFGPDRNLHFAGLCEELLETLAVEVPRSKALKDSIDLPSFDAAIAAARAALPTDLSAVQQLCNELEAARESSRQALAGTIEAHCIDWSLYHPSARQLLDDPFFWDPVDDDAPHGNDTGADLLSDYRSWRKRNCGLSGAMFAARWFRRRLGVGSAVSGLFANDMTVEARIALAFAQLKIDGEVDPSIAAAAVTAVEARMGRLVDDDARTKRLAMLRDRLLAAGQVEQALG